VLVATVIALAVLRDVSGGIRLGLIAGGAGFGLLGLVDDAVTVSPLRRLAIQFFLAAAVTASLVAGLSGAVAWRVAFIVGVVFWLVAFVNAFNFMDGINGISTLQVLVAATCWALIGASEGVVSVQAVSAVVGASALAFLPFNFPVARVFLGDVGSYFIGAVLGCTVVIALRAGLPADAVLAPLALYLVDTSVTIVRRVKSHKRWHEAHREHVYQRLVQLGYTHTQVALVATCVMVVCSALGAVSLTGAEALRGVADVVGLGVLTAYVVSPDLLSRRVAVSRALRQ